MINKILSNFLGVPEGNFDIDLVAKKYLPLAVTKAMEDEKVRSYIEWVIRDEVEKQMKILFPIDQRLNTLEGK